MRRLGAGLVGRACVSLALFALITGVGLAQLMWETGLVHEFWKRTLQTLPVSAALAIGVAVLATVKR